MDADRSDYQGKILPIGNLTEIVEAARADGKRIVQCHGCFDIVHPGHIRYLEFARRQGDVLVVSITPDDNRARGTNRPYIPQNLRAENLAALVFVDFVTVTEGATAVEVLELLTPDVYVKGREFENSDDPGFIAEKRVVENKGGRIIFSSGEPVYSADELADRVSGGPEFTSHQLTLYCRRHEISQDAVCGTLDRFRNLNVLVVGDIVIDRYVHCDALGVASESPVMSLVERYEHRFLGGAAIVARHVAALGARPFLLSSISEGDETDWVGQTLGNEQVETHLVPSRPAMVEKSRFLVDDTKVLKVDRAERCPLDSVAERHAAMILEQQSRLADAVIFCDFGYGMITGSLLSRILPGLRQNVRVLTADVSGGRANLLNFHNVDLLCPTEREVRAMLSDFDSGLSSVAWKLLDRTGARHLFVTLEKRGMVVFERGSQDRNSPDWSGRLRSDQLPSFAERISDRLGCGDAVLAASTLALAAGAPLQLTAYIGNAAAAIEIGCHGNRPVSITDLRDWLQRRRELEGIVAQRTVDQANVGKPSEVRRSKPATSAERDHV